MIGHKIRHKDQRKGRFHEMRELRFINLWLTIGFILVGVVCFLTLTPKPPEVPNIPAFDKIGHFSAYLVMTVWFGFIYLPGKRYISVGLAFIAMGVILELLQGIMGGRTAEYLDLLASTSGVIIGWLLARTHFAEALVYIERKIQIHPRHQ